MERGDGRTSMPLELRPEVAWFASKIEERMRQLESEGDDFGDCHEESLYAMLVGETLGLSETFKRGEMKGTITVAADVAGFAMRIACKKNLEWVDNGPLADED